MGQERTTQNQADIPFVHFFNNDHKGWLYWIPYSHWITRYIYYLQVVLSSPDYIYLDHPYEPHPEERGKHWATPYTDTRKIFGFAPVDLYKDITCNFSNCSQAQQNVVGKKCFYMQLLDCLQIVVLTTECWLLRCRSVDAICLLKDIQELFRKIHK